MVIYIYGPEGSGKTTLAHKLAEGYDNVLYVEGMLPAFWPSEMPDLIIWEGAHRSNVRNALADEQWLVGTGRTVLRPHLVITGDREPDPQWEAHCDQVISLRRVEATAEVAHE